MSQNPYTSPAATVATEIKPDSIALYSPNQAAVGALIGGPVGLVYFIRKNFVSLNNESAARNSLIYGALFIIALIAILPFLPAKFPSAPLNVVYILIARSVVEKLQASKSVIMDSSEFTFKSNWNVFLMGLLTLIGSVVAIMGPYMALIALGIVK